MIVRPLSEDEIGRVHASGLGLSRRPRGDGSFYLVACRFRRSPFVVETTTLSGKGART